MGWSFNVKRDDDDDDDDDNGDDGDDDGDKDEWPGQDEGVENSGTCHNWRQRSVLKHLV